MKPEILIVEDDPKISNLVALYVKNSGYEALQAYDGEEAMRLYGERKPCLIILDLMLPKVSGEEFCQWVKEGREDDPGVIMLSAKAKTDDKISGLKLGADDYVTKPFSPEELMAHVEAVLRRTGRLCQKIVSNGLVIKPRKGEVWLNDRLLELTHYEFNLLYFLMENAEHVFTREQLVQQIHPYGEAEIMGRTIDAHIKKLRRKIERDPAKPERILTVRGMGYKFVQN
ncbi:two-component system, OmpR family, alkaline phosphatase synthesis response regulator PhoP [Halobacillus alkaliphilus]|uniref:Two-component system, OmpR family, alkaline phosphatase synthesis response regulator PhoP n=1 Tax=Halobacillus alkaliphilus TaxID=396056 RepID=A0A1I2SPS1_9BACI|nr:response regulator transcription factor [Halobacillus alkaliphilus]SFG54632.1 two-component system, OmpR family, alkaline phosphatase synthesis response regulator PhoP [Halobacillus alkaliphilus]